MSDRVNITFKDGPMKDEPIAADRTPIMLRVAFDGRVGRCLNNADSPREAEAALAYIMDGSASVGFWNGRDPKTGRRIGGRMVMAAYRLLEPQPPSEVMRGPGAFAAWCDQHKTELMAEYERSRA